MVIELRELGVAAKQGEEPDLVVETKPDGRLQRRLRTRGVHAVRARETKAMANRARVLKRKVRRAKRRGLSCDKLQGTVDALNRRANRMAERFQVTICLRPSA